MLLAAHKGHVAVIQALLKKGADFHGGPHLGLAVRLELWSARV